MLNVYHTYGKFEDTQVRHGYQLPKTVSSQMNWKWMGVFVPFNKLAWGQLRTIKRVCQQNKSIWYGHHSDKWIQEIDKILVKENQKSAYIKAIDFLNVLADCQEC